MHFYKIISSILFSSIIFINLSAGEFTVSTYNCGGLSSHYDYLRAAAMQKLMQERYTAEPAEMALNEKIQELSLKILFSQNQEERLAAQKLWNEKKYQEHFNHLTKTPIDPGSPNAIWNQKADEMITTYKIRPVIIYDKELDKMLNQHLRDLTKKTEGNRDELLEEARAVMAKRIFAHHMKFDIICLQEADYLDASTFPRHYETAFSQSAHSINGVAWNKNRFDHVETIGSIVGRGFVVKLQDKDTGKIILAASGHLSGCNPFMIEKGKNGESDSAKGDAELKQIIQVLQENDGDVMVIGMDSNVTPMHPRLKILKNSGFQIDYENYLEPTCTNPYQVLNTRIDWIAVKPKDTQKASIANIPVTSVGLNNHQTNISDHKPVGAKIQY